VLYVISFGPTGHRFFFFRWTSPCSSSGRYGGPFHARHSGPPSRSPIRPFFHNSEMKGVFFWRLDPLCFVASASRRSFLSTSAPPADAGFPLREEFAFSFCHKKKSSLGACLFFQIPEPFSLPYPLLTSVKVSMTLFSCPKRILSFFFFAPPPATRDCAPTLPNSCVRTIPLFL